MTSAPTYVHIDSVCADFQVTRATVKRWVRLNRLPRLLKVGGQLYFDGKELREKLSPTHGGSN